MYKYYTNNKKIKYILIEMDNEILKHIIFVPRNKHDQTLVELGHDLENKKIDEILNIYNTRSESIVNGEYYEELKKIFYIYKKYIQ